MGKPTCAVDGCDRPTVGRGLCRRHYHSWYRHGDPLAAKPRRRYVQDDHYFDVIDTPEKAYWLGFITADGCVALSGGGGELKVALAERDAGHLVLLMAALKTDRPIKWRTSVSGYGGTPNASITVGSRPLADALCNLGVTPRKSASARPWNGPAHLMVHYWRGLFDGDGSLGPITTRGHWNVQICGSKPCVAGFASWAASVCGTRAQPVLTTRSELCWQWTCNGSFKPQALVRALYQDADVALERKRALVAQLLALDFGELRRAGNERRAASMRAAWQNGTHARSRLR